MCGFGMVTGGGGGGGGCREEEGQSKTCNALLGHVLL